MSIHDYAKLHAGTICCRTGVLDFISFSWAFVISWEIRVFSRLLAAVLVLTHREWSSLAHPRMHLQLVSPQRTWSRWRQEPSKTQGSTLFPTSAVHSAQCTGQQSNTSPLVPPGCCCRLRGCSPPAGSPGAACAGWKLPAWRTRTDSVRTGARPHLWRHTDQTCLHEMNFRTASVLQATS